MAENVKLLGIGLTMSELAVGDILRTRRRTIQQSDRSAFINLVWLTEELFATERQETSVFAGDLVPAALVYSFAEGLVRPFMEATGIAFLGAELNVEKPTFVGDTIHVDMEVIEARPTSRGDRGLVRTRNSVIRGNGDVVLVYTPLRLMKIKQDNI